MDKTESVQGTLSHFWNEKTNYPCELYEGDISNGTCVQGTRQ